MPDSKYLGRVAIDDDTTLPDDPITPGTSGHLDVHKILGQFARVVETFIGTGSTLAPAAGKYLAGTGAGTADWQDVTLFPATHEPPFLFVGTVTSPTTGTVKWLVEQPGTLLSIRAVLGTPAASGSALTVDLRKNGSTVLSTKPSITVGQSANTNSPAFSNTGLVAGDLLSVNIDTGTDGANLLVIVKYRDN